jgi:WD40-like Beta Propeller Repeat
LIDWQRQLPSRFLPYAWGVHVPVWSPDGRWVAYTGSRDGLYIHRKAVNADTPDEQLTFSTKNARPNDWSGNVLVYEEPSPGTGWDLWYLPLVTPRRPAPFLQTPFSEVQGHLSPDGKWLAYTSDESGALEVYVQSFPIAGDKRRVSTSGGAQPKWRSDGKELFYLSADRHLMVAEVRSQSPLVLGDPKPLFATGIRGPTAIAPASNNNYAVTSDGQRFYVNTSVEPSNTAPITVVLNWTQSLR